MVCNPLCNWSIFCHTNICVCSVIIGKVRLFEIKKHFHRDGNPDWKESIQIENLISVRNPYYHPNFWLNIILIIFILSRLVVLFVVMLIFLIIMAVLVITQIQQRKPKYLPETLRSWKFLPLCLRSLKPYDDLIIKYFFCFKFCQKIVIRKNSLIEEEKKVNLAVSNKAFIDEYAFWILRIIVKNWNEMLNDKQTRGGLKIIKKKMKLLFADHRLSINIL